MTLDYFLEILSILFVIIDPPGLVPIFIGLTQDKSLVAKRQLALKACLVSFSILVGFTVLGDTILDKLRISEPAFRIAGAIILLLTGINMVISYHNHSTEKISSYASGIAIFPIAIPLIAGPGSLVSVVMLMREHEGDYVYGLFLILAIALVIGITYVFLQCSNAISRVIGSTGAEILTRIFGIILSALAIQFMINGINDIVHVPCFKKF